MKRAKLSLGLVLALVISTGSWTVASSNPDGSRWTAQAQLQSDNHEGQSGEEGQVGEAGQVGEVGETAGANQNEDKDRVEDMREDLQSPPL